MADDIRENAMGGGTPKRLRGLDANGNSISPTLAEVAKALPKRNQFDVEIAAGEEYSLSVSVYNTLFLYETSSIGFGCMIFLGWERTEILGNSAFSNNNTAGKICIYNIEKGKYAIKNGTSKSCRLTVNVV